MWIGEDGTTPTVAVPEWADVVDVRVDGRAGGGRLTPEDVERCS